MKDKHSDLKRDIKQVIVRQADEHKHLRDFLKEFNVTTRPARPSKIKEPPKLSDQPPDLEDR